MFSQAKLDTYGQDAEILSLKGRLFKDRALKAEGSDRVRLLIQAKEAYLSAAGLGRATYPLINAATIALLIGDPNEAQAIASKTLDILDSGDHEAETPYWLKATRAEAALLIGDLEGGRKALADAIAAAPFAWEDHASTLRHFRLVLEQLDQSSAWLDRHRPPPSLHFSGIIDLAEEDEVVVRIEKALDKIRPASAYGALAAGADILIAERLLVRDVALHAVFPAPVATFRAESVACFGSHWAERFDAVIERAETVHVTRGPDRVSLASVHVAEQVAMGMAIRNAALLESHALALRISASGTSTQREQSWARQGLRTSDISVIRPVPPAQTLPKLERAAVVALAGEWDIDALHAAGGRVESVEGQQIMIWFSEPVDAARALLAGNDDELTGRAAAIDYRAVDPDARAQSGELARLLGRAGQGKRITVSESMAMALALEAPDLCCEKLGELASALGDLPIYSLR